MRDTFARTMTELATEREDICLLSGDIGNRMFDRFKEVAPERFINCGIAESNMMSVAAGMGLSGLRPVVYTITPFTTIRCLEQIRIGVAYHQSPVVIVGTGSGLSYAELGPTHHSLEDMAILRSVPGINILAPADSVELTEQLREALDAEVPTYIRIGKKGERILHGKKSNLGIGKGNFLRDGSDLLVLGLGPILDNALRAAEIAEEHGVSVAIGSLGGIRPLDTAFLGEMATRFKRWISIEEHYVYGGLSTTLQAWMSDSGCGSVKLKSLGVPDVFIHELGSQEYVRAQLGLDVNSLLGTYLDEYREGKEAMHWH